MRVLLFAVVVASLIFFAAASPAALTEKDLQKLKIKELRQFLDDRGLTCHDCQEKNDFVRFALQHVNVPVRAEKVKAVIPSGTLWEVWAHLAKELCEAKASEVQKKDVCPAIATAVESIFMQHGKRTAAKLKKKPEAVLKTSWGETYQAAGRKYLTRVVNYCLKAPNKATCSSGSKLQTVLETKDKIKGVDFVMYLTNVGIENTNPMYEIMKEKSPHDEL